MTALYLHIVKNDSKMICQSCGLICAERECYSIGEKLNCPAPNCVGDMKLASNEEVNARERIKELAETIRNNKQLRRVVKAAKPELQEAVYNMIIAHIKFVPLSFKRL